MGHGFNSDVKLSGGYQVFPADWRFSLQSRFFQFVSDRKDCKEPPRKWDCQHLRFNSELTTILTPFYLHVTGFTGLFPWFSIIHHHSGHARGIQEPIDWPYLPDYRSELFKPQFPGISHFYHHFPRFVVPTPLKKMNVSWDDSSQYMGKLNSSSKSPTRLTTINHY